MNIDYVYSPDYSLYKNCTADYTSTALLDYYSPVQELYNPLL